MSQESLFTYTINVNKGGAPITDLELTIANVAFTGTGTVDVQEFACIGGSLPACTGGKLERLEVYDGANRTQLFDSVNLLG